MNTKVFRKINYGLYIVASRKKDHYNGQVANTVFQVSNEPPKVAVSINKENLTHEFIADSGIFSVSILSQDVPLSLIGQFGFQSGRDGDKFSGVNYSLTSGNVPYLIEHTLGYLEARVIGQADAGTHTIFIGEVTGAEVLGEGEPMTYAYYHLVKKGGAPKSAPVPPPDKEEKKKSGDRYVCSVCGYIYDPEAGDPDGGIEPGTSFDELPEDWVCPVCGAGKDEFEKE